MSKWYILTLWVCFKQSVPENLYKKPDDSHDNHSETSGETTTSDSGRGGSESDIQSSNSLLSHSLEIGNCCVLTVL